jgi:hypothetical protein
MASFTHSQPKSRFAALSFAMLTSAWQEARQYFSDSYRPELHYMRGPGPKWQAKYGHLAQEGDPVA